jgi:ABC-type branched-subunit amino acid transport system ATPase component
MSYGEQRLLSIAVALAASPRLLMLDEPAAGLNPSEAEQLGQKALRVARRARALRGARRRGQREQAQLEL